MTAHPKALLGIPCLRFRASKQCRLKSLEGVPEGPLGTRYRGHRRIRASSRRMTTQPGPLGRVSMPGDGTASDLLRQLRGDMSERGSGAPIPTDPVGRGRRLESSDGSIPMRSGAQVNSALPRSQKISGRHLAPESSLLSGRAGAKAGQGGGRRRRRFSLQCKAMKCSRSAAFATKPCRESLSGCAFTEKAGLRRRSRAVLTAPQRVHTRISYKSMKLAGQNLSRENRQDRIPDFGR